MPEDYWPVLKASFETIMHHLGGKEGHSQEVQDAAQMMQEIAASVRRTANPGKAETGAVNGR